MSPATSCSTFLRFATSSSFESNLFFFKDIRLRLGSKDDAQRVVNYVRGGVVLHNFLRNDEEEANWFIEREGEDDLEPEPVDRGSNTPDYRRREELLFCLSELEDTVINQSQLVLFVL